MTTPTCKSRFIYHLPDYWTPEQALAVLELFDDLREVIWAHYDLKVIDELRAQHLSDPSEPSSSTSGDDSFYLDRGAHEHASHRPRSPSCRAGKGRAALARRGTVDARGRRHHRRRAKVRQILPRP